MVGEGGVMDLICMYPSCVPDPLFLLWKEGGGKNEIDVMPSKVIGLSQVLELFNIRIRVSGEGAKALFYLREVNEGKGDMVPHNAFHCGHFPESVDGNWLTGGSVRTSVWGAHGILWSWVGGRVGRRRGRRKGRRRSGRRSRRRSGRKSGSQLLKNGSLSLVRWRLISRVERRESFRVRRGFREGFGWF
jgi:hypothetical protein